MVYKYYIEDRKEKKSFSFLYATDAEQKKLFEENKKFTRKVSHVFLSMKKECVRNQKMRKVFNKSLLNSLCYYIIVINLNKR